jgi:hypothetical protein
MVKKIALCLPPFRQLYNEIQNCRDMLSSKLEVDKNLSLNALCRETINRLNATETILAGNNINASNAGSEQKPPIKSPELLGRVSFCMLKEEIKNLRNSLILSNKRDLPISAFVINYNEHPVLELSLLSLYCCSELIVVDKGSSDESKNLYPLYATKVIETPWTPIVEDTRADSNCSLEWRLFLDADEFLTLGAIRLLREAMKMDAAGKFPYDAIAFPKVNYIFGEKAEHNMYAGLTFINCYRKGFFKHERSTHNGFVSSHSNIRVKKVGYDSDALIIHLNQDNLFEFIEKTNRYTETYITKYPDPKSAEDIYNFILKKISDARKSTKDRNGNTYDAVCESMAVFYYSIELMKQWEHKRNISIDKIYTSIVRKYFLE